MYTFNEQIFDTIDNADKAYLLGFICADGCVYKRPGHQGQLSISLKDTDSEILQHFKFSMQSNHPIQYITDVRRNTTRMATLVFVNEHLFQRLGQIGICEQKTYSIDYNIVLSYIPEQFLQSFFLGLFDGDGNIDYPKNGTISKSHVRLSGPIEQLKQLQKAMPFGNLCSVIQDNRSYEKPFGSLEAKGTIGKYCVLKYIYSIPIESLFRKKENAQILISRIENNVTNRAENIRATNKWKEYISSGVK